MALSVLCVPEIISALNRRLREGSLTKTQYLEAKKRFSLEVADATIIHLTSDVVREAISILERNGIRAMDALPVACAVQWGADLFVSSDERQLEAAKTSNHKIQKG